jgi:hypothetical protein
MEFLQRSWRNFLERITIKGLKNTGNFSNMLNSGNNSSSGSTEEGQDQELLKKVFDCNERILTCAACSYGALNGKLYATENTIYFFSPDTSQKVFLYFLFLF